MKKELGVNPYLFPMPVLMIATYGDGDVVDVMNMAWGGICAENMVSLNISADHKTSENIKKRGAFTLSVADVPHIEAADFFGIASGNKMTDKFERTGYHARKSELINAPIIDEFPVVMECELAEVCSTDSFYAIVGRIVNTAAEDTVLSENGKIDPSRLNALIFDQFQHSYYVSGEQVGKAWHEGASLMKK